MGRGGELIPAAHADWFAKGFGAYNRRLIAKRFCALRVSPSLRPLCAMLDADPRPAIVVLNHAAWWDPLIILAIGATLLPSRRGIAPIDAAQLRRFGFFRKLGLFGIDPDDPASMNAMLGYVDDWFKTAPKPTLALTTQGRFTDVREPIVNRPGAAAVAARCGPRGVNVLSIAIEYAFWQDQRPEAFVRAALIEEPPACTTAAWHRAIRAGMQANADALARDVIARDPGAFEVLIGAGAPRINPAYDLWLKLRGRSGAIQARRTPTAPAPARVAVTPPELGGRPS